MLMVREASWWYWLVTAALLFVGLAGRSEAFVLAVALSAVQLIHFLVREGSVAAFPVQVRVAYTALVLACLWSPLNALYWLPAIGTLAQVLFGYCLLARCISLLPWNRCTPLSWALVRRTFLARPVPGSVMQGLPAAR